MSFTNRYADFIKDVRSRNESLGIDIKSGRNHKIISKSKLKNNLEVHHILPKTNGGTNDKRNLIALTHDEHIYAHFLLNMVLFENPTIGRVKGHQLLSNISIQTIRIACKHIPDLFKILKVNAAVRTSFDNNQITFPLEDIARYIMVIRNSKDHDFEKTILEIIRKAMHKRRRTKARRILFDDGYVSVSFDIRRNHDFPHFSKIFII